MLFKASINLIFLKTSVLKVFNINVINVFIYVSRTLRNLNKLKIKFKILRQKSIIILDNFFKNEIMIWKKAKMIHL